MKERVKNNLNILIRYNRTINHLCSLLGASELGILDEISASFGEYVLMDMVGNDADNIPDEMYETFWDIICMSETNGKELDAEDVIKKIGEHE